MAATRLNRILLTGAAGKLGSMLRARLTADCQILRIADRTDLGVARSQEEVMIGDLADANTVMQMMADVDAVVHMGGVSVEGPSAPILAANIIGVSHLYEAARKCGRPRILFASSNHVTGFYRRDEKINPLSPKRPDGFYGVSKSFGEDLSRFYFDRYGIETACLRLGSVCPKPVDRRMLSSWLSYDDLHRLIQACLTVPKLGHDIIYGVSNNARSWWNNTAATRIGYQPQDSADQFAAEILAGTVEPDPQNLTTIFQGGSFVNAGPFDG